MFGNVQNAITRRLIITVPTGVTSATSRADGSTTHRRRLFVVMTRRMSMKNPASPRDRKNSEPQTTNQGEGDQAAAKRFNQKEQAFVQSERGRQAIKAGVARQQGTSRTRRCGTAKSRTGKRRRSRSHSKRPSTSAVPDEMKTTVSNIDLIPCRRHPSS